MRRCLFLPALLLGWFACQFSSAAEVTLEQDDAGVTVKVDGQLFTRYLIKSETKPVLWPVIGPTGKEMTRGYPLRDATPEEKNDHIHHRSIWFTHGKVNNVDFWSENKGHGTIEHREFTKVQSGPTGTFSSRNDWIGPDGKKVCEDERTLRFGSDASARWIDFDVIMKATEGELTFGDTKEGSFGVRVNETMKVEAKKGGKIINSEGQTDGAAWGKPAAWVDYHGPAHGEHLGVAVLNHPSSYRFPTHWHVRTYGLFAANPWGLHDFSGSKDINGADTLKPNSQISLRYRVVLHKGDETNGNIAVRYATYAKDSK